MIIGASFSKVHLESLDINPLDALDEFKKLNLKWLRTSLYWSDIEKQKGRRVFAEYKKLIKRCEELGLNVILTVGAKAIRWPEFYFPKWVDKKNYDDDLLSFIKESVSNFKDFKNIRIWQVENEPLDPIWPSEEKISFGLLKKEVELVRKTDSSREIMINLWGNELKKRGVYREVAELADIIGLDLYLKCPNNNEYLDPEDDAKTIEGVTKRLQAENKKVFVAELQAEPWEEDDLVSKQKNPPSFGPRDFKINFNYAKSLNPDGIFFWGFEYWLWKKKNGDYRYWNRVRDFSTSANKSLS